MRTDFTPTAYAAILRTLRRGGLFVARDRHCSLTTVTAIARRHGDIRKTVTVNDRTGRRSHITAGVMLNRNGLTCMRDQILAAGDEIPDTLAAALEQTAPRPTVRT